MKKILLVSSIFIFYSTQATLNSLCHTVLKNYTRPVTILEIGTSPHAESHWIEKKYDAVCAVTVVGDCDTEGFISHCTRHHRRIILLHPYEFTAHTLEKLSACEHFDVVIVHYPEQFRCGECLHLFEQLGDNLLLECSRSTWNAQNTLAGSCVYEEDEEQTHRAWIQHTRSELRKSRWNLEKELHGYEIISTYSEKALKKHRYDTTTSWIPGINLMTAVALNVEYPTHAHIQTCINDFKSVEHNDLVISNMILQGNNLTLIDFADPRRNAQQKKLFKIAYKLFGWRYKNVTAEQKLTIYMQLVKKLKKN